ncbi:unnamed protein product, partial [Ectocarpus sp. 8 AP-2014]
KPREADTTTSTSSAARRGAGLSPATVGALIGRTLHLLNLPHANMEFEGEDQRTLNELVRTLSGRLDLLIDGDQPPHQRAAGAGGGGGGGASPSAEDAHGP